MIVRAEGEKVVVRFPHHDPDVYATLFAELDDARLGYEPRLGDLSTSELRPYLERLIAAEDDVDEAFTVRLTPEAAERIHTSLFAAIVAAKVNRRDFNHDKH